MNYHVGQHVELRTACGPFVRGQIVTISAAWLLPATTIQMFTLTVGAGHTTATAADFGAVQGELASMEDRHMARKNGADLSANTGVPAGDGAIPPSTEIAPSPATAYPVGQVVALPLDLIDPDPDNERTDLGDIAALAASMAVEQEEPIQVYRQANGRYMNKTGHRRSAAARLLGWTTIAALVVPPPADARQRALGRIVSNLLREDPNIMLLAERLRDTLVGGDVDQTDLAAQLGKSQSWISNTIRLLHLPEPVRALISSGQLTAGHGVQLLRVTAPEVQSWSGQPTGKSAADKQLQYAQATAAQGSSVATLTAGLDRYLEEQKTGGHYAAQRVAQEQQEAAVRARVEQIRAEAITRGEDPTKAVKAAAQAERHTADTARSTQEAATRVKEQAAREREQARRVDRAALSDGVIDRIIGYQPGAAPTLDHLRLLGRMALQVTGRFGYGYGEQGGRLAPALDQAGDYAGLMPVLAAIARAGLPLDIEGRELAGNDQVKKWADHRWYLNVQIADDLLNQGKINRLSHTTLISGKPQPPPPHGPTERATQVAAQAEVQCPNCAGDFAPTPTDTVRIGSGPELRCPFCAQEFTPAPRAAAA